MEMVTPPKQNSACMAETAETPVQSPLCEKKSQLANNYGFCCSRLAVGVGLDSESATFFGSHADRPSHFKALALIEDSSWLQPPRDPLKCIKIKPYGDCMALSLCILVEIRKLAWLGVSIPLPVTRGRLKQIKQWRGKKPTIGRSRSSYPIHFFACPC